MNILLILLLVLIGKHTINGAEESFSKLIQLYQYGETQMNQIKINFATQMENSALQQKKFANELRSESVFYLKEEISKLDLSTFEQPDIIKDRITSCAEIVNSTIEASIEKFITTLDDAEEMIYQVEVDLHKEPSSDDIDEINDEVDDIIDEFKEKYEINISPRVDGILNMLRQEIFSLRVNLKKMYG